MIDADEELCLCLIVTRVIVTTKDSRSQVRSEVEDGKKEEGRIGTARNGQGSALINLSRRPKPTK